MQPIPADQLPAVVAQVAAYLAKNGMVIVPADSVMQKKQKELMKRKAVTLVQADKYGLLPISRKTIISYLEKGIFSSNEVYVNPGTGKWEILTRAIERYNKEIITG